MTLTVLRQRLTIDIPPQERTAYGLMACWVFTMISLPIVGWTLGEDAIPAGIIIAAIFQASAAFYIITQQWGFQRALLTFLGVGVIGWAAEFLGHRTGFPFGDYTYTERLQPQIGGVPALIPIAWFMLFPSVWYLAQLIVRERRTLVQKVTFIAISAVALTAWDLFLDPQMVGWGFWTWAEPSGYFGIPWSNYAGWLLVSAIITLVVNPPRLQSKPLALMYGVVWFLQTIGQAVFWGQVGPAVIGAISMGSIMALAYWRTKAQPS